jgi:hypothetical protein
MKQEFSTLSVVNHYRNGKLTGYSVGDGEIVSLSEEEPLTVPELFPIRPEYQKKSPCSDEPLEVPTMEDWFKKKDK